MLELLRRRIGPDAYILPNCVRIWLMSRYRLDRPSAPKTMEIMGSFLWFLENSTRQYFAFPVVPVFPPRTVMPSGASS